MSTRGFFPQQGQMQMGRPPFQGPIMGSGQIGQQIPTRSGGLKGLISRFMPGSQGVSAGANPQGMIQGAAGATRASGALQGLTNPANISGMLGNVQKVLGMAQQVTPMVQQYGPLVKNLPAMIKIYRELKNGDTVSDDNDDIVETDVSDTKPSVETSEDNETNLQFEEKNVENNQPRKRSSNKSVSKLANEEVNTLPDNKNPSSTTSRSKPKLYI